MESLRPNLFLLCMILATDSSLNEEFLPFMSFAVQFLLSVLFSCIHFYWHGCFNSLYNIELCLEVSYRGLKA